MAGYEESSISHAELCVDLIDAAAKEDDEDESSGKPPFGKFYAHT